MSERPKPKPVPVRASRMLTKKELRFFAISYLHLLYPRSRAMRG